MQINGNTVNITANLWIYGEGADIATYQTGGRPKRLEKQYSDLVISGMQEEWSGRYWIDGRWVTVNVTARDNNINHSIVASADSRYLNVEIFSGSGLACGGVGNPADWSRSAPGTIRLVTIHNESTDYLTDSEFKWVTGHELGHVLGMDDACKVTTTTHWTRSDAPEGAVPQNDMMRVRGGVVSVFDMGLALQAFNDNMVQFFPGKW